MPTAKNVTKNQFSDDSLYQALLELAVINKNTLDQIYKDSKAKKISLQTQLLEKDLISDENLGKIISDLVSLPFIQLSNVSIPVNILKILPESVAKKQKVIVFGADATGVKVAISNPASLEILDMIAKKTGQKVLAYFATTRDIEGAFRFYQQEIQKSFDELLKEQVHEAGQNTNTEAPIIKIVDLMIEYAYQDKASDIHIEPEDKGSLVRFRIDGVLHDVLHLPKEIHDQVVTRIKVLSKLRTDEHLSAQDGKLQVKLEEEDLDIRVSIVPIVEGEKVVMRLLSARSRQFSLTDLGMSDKDLAKVKKGFIRPFGMVLATGPTGSGKTTTIYAILKILNVRERNISTIEDPVEYDIDGINQIQVNPKTNLTFADGLRSILRQDPDTIFVGEIRDKDTAGIAVNSAMTGHLVLSTLHTNDAATSLPRLIDMDVEPFLVASTVNTIIAQRLVRKICEKCRYSLTMLASDLAKNLPAEQIKKYFGEKAEIRLYQGRGCPVCHTTGYVGRVGIFEVLEITPAIRELITAKADSGVIAKKAVEEGMTTMFDDGISKVQMGITTIEEILRATNE